MKLAIYYEMENSFSSPRFKYSRKGWKERETRGWNGMSMEARIASIAP